MDRDWTTPRGAERRLCRGVPGWPHSGRRRASPGCRGQGSGLPVAAEIYNVGSDTWKAVENGTDRWNHTATLRTGASCCPEARLSTRILRVPADLSAARTLHASALLPD